VTASIATIVADLLDEAGIRRCYTILGESFLEILDAVERHAGLSLIFTPHESGLPLQLKPKAS
jgi:acetolactate synthase-1/2/3 large subunit